MKSLIQRLLARYLSTMGLVLHAVPDEEDRLDLNVQHTASESEVNELDGELDPKGTQNSDDQDDQDDPDDEDQSKAKRSQEELETGSDAERQSVRERKRQDRLNQRQRAQRRIETLERQLANALSANQEVNQRVSSLENANLSTQAAQLERQAQEAAQAEQMYKDILAEATVKQDGARAAEATQGLIEIQRRRELIHGARQNLETQARQPRAQPLDAEVVNHARSFMAENPWYKGPRSTDLDSQILSLIDNTMTREGWDPRSPSYWTELRSRAAERLSHRFKGGAQAQSASQGGEGGGGYNPPNDRRPQRSPVAGSSSNNSGGGEASTRYTLSPERVRAMKEAGYWDDPKKRQSMVKRYQDMDRQLANERRN